MSQITVTADVASRLGRPLTADELMLAGVLIDDAENMIRARVPGHDLLASDLDPEMVRQVVAAAVGRVIRNPDGYRQESVGSVSYSIDTRAAAGFLTILADEWTLLGLAPLRPGAGLGSIAPTLGTAYGTPRIGPGWWSWP